MKTQKRASLEEKFQLKHSTRFELSKKLTEELFKKWLSQKNTQSLIHNLVSECKTSEIKNSPQPFFVTKSGSVVHTTTFIAPVARQSTRLSLNPAEIKSLDPRTRFKNIIQMTMNKDNLITIDRITTSDPYKKTNKPIDQEKTLKIPKFYPREVVNLNLESDMKIIDQAFNKNDCVDFEEFTLIFVDLLKFPLMLKGLLFDQIKNADEKVEKSKFVEIFRESFENKNQKLRFFNLFKLGHKRDYLIRSDFLPMMKLFLENHPGLEFLKSHPEFQEKYSQIVSLRIFFENDLNYDDKLSFREFKKSNLVEIIYKTCEEPDINKIRDYFSYEHFYVLYCKFWEIDNEERDFLLSKEEVMKYDGHSLSRKAIERIFMQIPKKFKSGYDDKMGFEDFVWFMLCEENKCSRTAIEYWFKVLDLDNNGIVTPVEIKYFYDEQIIRLNSLGEEPVEFQDLICQLTDMVKPEIEYQFILKNFLDSPQDATIFFNCLFNLTKFQNIESKDPNSKSELERNPEYNDWDRYAYYEYAKLTAEDPDANQEDADELSYQDEGENENKNVENHSEAQEQGESTQNLDISVDDTD